MRTLIFRDTLDFYIDANITIIRLLSIKESTIFIELFFITQAVQKEYNFDLYSTFIQPQITAYPIE